MTPPPSDSTSENAGFDEQAESLDANRLCDAATAVFFTIIRDQARREGRPIPVPFLMCPRTQPRCPCAFTRDEVIAAEAFLLRLGFIERRHDMPVVDL